ncbi:hypothetical protein NLG97_g5692 [Lecanicillium saksenae]|uniref:Uncharacterized protein n=1 Tax=Lecanicillium saksenae TaxID=468837 RepID=A0ACC1QTF0_9HYPO|nr:hypothetical protein NLG97_g5692 [Lecanicillium saksenae]
MSLLLKAGMVLLHNERDEVVPTRADVLIEGNRITRIESCIKPTIDCQVIECSDKIVSPGFVDTHHHVWQSPFKGIFGDMALLPYLAITHASGLAFTDRDMFWANLSGNMEAIDAGTTTTLDHAHMNWSNTHSRAAIAGTISSGIRSIFAYTPVSRVLATRPEVQFASEALPEWVMETFEDLAASKALTDSQARVQLGFGWDFYFLPADVTKNVFAKARAAGAKLITSHFIRHVLDLDGESLVSKLHSADLLGSDMLLSHAGGATPEDVELLRKANCFISATPNTEEAMQVGPTVPFRQNLPGVNALCSLGVDCHSATSSSLVNEMRLVLQMARGRDSEQHIRAGVRPADVSRKAAEVFNMGTIQGARAMKMERDIGSIRVGKNADIVLFDALSPSMYCAAQQDPVLAIVLHSSIRDVDTVIVDRCIRKQHGKMLPVNVTEYEKTDFGEIGCRVGWAEVAQHVMELQKRFVDKMDEYNLSELESAIRKNWGLDG